MSKDKIILKTSQNSEILIISKINILEDNSVELSMAAYEIKERDIVINPPESELNKLAEEKRLVTIPQTREHT